MSIPSKAMRVWLCIAGVVASGSSVAGDPSARDWLPAPVGTDMVLGYFGTLSSHGVYDGGKRVSGAPGMDMQMAIYRQMHYRELAGKTVQYEVIVPVIRKSIGTPREHMQGVGDISVGTAVWFLNNEASRTYFAWEPFITLPTGRYHGSRADISPGANRWTTVQDFAFVQGFGESSYVELMAEFEFYGRNTNYYGATLKKDPSVRLMTLLSTNITESTYVGMRYRYETGGKEKLNGDTATGSANSHQLAAEITHQFTNQHQLQLQYIHDLEVRHGPRLTGVQLRYGYAF